MRERKAWMTLTDAEISGMDDGWWAHYWSKGCVCSALNDDECICGAREEEAK